MWFRLQKYMISEYSNSASDDIDTPVFECFEYAFRNHQKSVWKFGQLEVCLDHSSSNHDCILTEYFYDHLTSSFNCCETNPQYLDLGSHRFGIMLQCLTINQDCGINENASSKELFISSSLNLPLIWSRVIEQNQRWIGSLSLLNFLWVSFTTFEYFIQNMSWGG